MEVPLLQAQIASLYLPYEDMQTVIALIGDDWLSLWDGYAINQDVLASMDPEQVRELQYNLVETLPNLPPEFNDLFHQLIREISE